MSALIIYAAALALLLPLVWSHPPGACHSCGSALPSCRKAASARQALWGGWTCGGCGAVVDRVGEPIRSEA